MATTEATALLPHSEHQPPAAQKSSFLDFLRAFWPIVFIGFGGPSAHVALMHDKFVDVPPAHTGPRVSLPVFLELYALSQSLPGPGSTQLIASVGALFGGFPGAAATFFLWQLPGFAFMTAAGLWFHANMHRPDAAPLINAITDRAVGLIAAAFAFVLIAAYKLFNKTCAAHPVKVAISLAVMFVAVVCPPAWSPWLFILLLAAGGAAFLAYSALRPQPAAGAAREQQPALGDDWQVPLSVGVGAALLAAVAAVTVAIALLPRGVLKWRVLKMFWRIGLSVFGGGIVVVPMLINELVESAMLPQSVFRAGFGLFGCIPGPMFNLAPFLGAAVAGFPGAVFGSVGIFAPGVLLQLGILPFWLRIRTIAVVQTVLQGVNSASVGLIGAGVWMLLSKALAGPAAFALMCSAGAMSVVYELSPVPIIVSHGVVGALMASFGIGGPYHLHQSISV